MHLDESTYISGEAHFKLIDYFFREHEILVLVPDNLFARRSSNDRKKDSFHYESKATE